MPMEEVVEGPELPCRPEASLLRQRGRIDWLDVATRYSLVHGCYALRGAQTGRAAAGANRLRSGRDDGVLTALEVAGLDLAGTELAVLSARETGVGAVQNGEGVYGMRRALVLAGVRTQIASLWKVDDAATRDLMIDYYRRLQADAGRSQALREAQLTMLKDPARAHPYYWASFIAIGEEKALNR